VYNTVLQNFTPLGNAAIPASFMQTYPVAEAVVITPENYLDYL